MPRYSSFDEMRVAHLQFELNELYVCMYVYRRHQIYHQDFKFMYFLKCVGFQRVQCEPHPRHIPSDPTNGPCYDIRRIHASDKNRPHGRPVRKAPHGA